MARPAKQEAEKRGEKTRQTVRFTMAEQEYVRQQSERLGLSVAEYIRQKSLSGQARPKTYRRGVDPALVTEVNELGLQLARLGNVTNQVARHIHTDEARRLPHGYESLPAQIHRSQEMVMETLAKLLGSDD